jgi:hypothetical protein
MFHIASVFITKLMGILACLSIAPSFHQTSNTSSSQTHCLHFIRSYTSLQHQTSFTKKISIFSLDCDITSHWIHTYLGSHITFIWILEHAGLQDHHAVDQAAEQANSSQKVTDNSPYHLPATAYKNHYRSLILMHWNNFWKNHPLPPINSLISEVKRLNKLRHIL